MRCAVWAEGSLGKDDRTVVPSQLDCSAITILPREADQLTTSMEEAKRRLRQAVEEKRRTEALAVSLQV